VIYCRLYCLLALVTDGSNVQARVRHTNSDDAPFIMIQQRCSHREKERENNVIDESRNSTIYMLLNRISISFLLLAALFLAVAAGGLSLLVLYFFSRNNCEYNINMRSRLLKVLQ